MVLLVGKSLLRTDSGCQPTASYRPSHLHACMTAANTTCPAGSHLWPLPPPLDPPFPPPTHPHPHPPTQSKRALMENIAQNRGELRLRMDNIRKTDPSLAVQSLPEPEKWGVQLFRSIDSGRGWGRRGGREGKGSGLR